MGELVKTMKQLTSKMCVSCTRNATFQKRVLASACFVYAKRYVQKTGRFSSTRNISFFWKLRSRLRETLLFRVKEDRARPPGTLCELEGGSQTAWTGDRPKLSLFYFFLCTLCGKMTCKFRSEIPASSIWLQKRNGLACEQLAIRFHEGPCEMPEWTFSSAGGSAWGAAGRGLGRVKAFEDGRLKVNPLHKNKIFVAIYICGSS